MIYYQQIFTLGTFALYTFIFSLFIVPTVNNLKQIRTQLRRIIEPESFLKENKGIKEEKKEIEKITNILEDYKLEHKEIERLRWFLVWGIIATFFALAAQFYFGLSAEMNIFQYVFNNPKLIALGIYFLTIASFIIGAFFTYVPSQKRITEWEYLFKNFGLSPQGLAKCADFRIDINYHDKSIWDYYDPKETRPIRLCSDIELRGYKYWFFIYNLDDKKVVFNIAGIIKKNTDLYELYPDIKELRGWYLNIGNFNAFPVLNKNLRMYFLIFDPILFRNGKGWPYWGYNDLKLTEEVVGSTQYKISVQKVAYPKIMYRGRSLRFYNLEWQQKEEGFNLPQDQLDQLKTAGQWEIIEPAFRQSKEVIRSTRKSSEVIPLI